MGLAIFETSVDRHRRTRPIAQFGVRKAKRSLFSSRDLKAIVYSVLALISSSALLVVLLVQVFLSNEPFSISDSLKDIRLVIKKLDREKFVQQLSHEEQDELATQVKLVSEIIGRSNRAVDRKGLAVSIVAESMRAQIDPLFVTAVVKSESTFKSGAVSSAGARGLMQLLPSTAKFTEQNIAAPVDKGNSRNLHHTEYNLQMGIAYLKHLQEMFSGNRELALIAYNWGPGNVINALKNRSEFPQETKFYAQKILKNHKLWQKELTMNARNDALVTKKLA